MLTSGYSAAPGWAHGAGPRYRGGDDGAARAGGRALHPSAHQPRPRLQTAGPANDRGQYRRAAVLDVRVSSTRSPPGVIGPGCPAPVVVLGRPPVVLAVLGVREAVRFGARSDAPSRLVPHLTVVGVDGPTAVLIIYSPPPWGATVPTAAPSEEVDGPRGGMSCAERLSEVERRGSQGPALDRRAAFRITCSGALRAGRSTLCLSERSLWVCCLRSR